MEEHFDQITAIALVTLAALACGLFMIRLRQPAIVGYIVAGIVLGPTGMKMVSNTDTIQILAELGVIMLLFLIGMKLDLKGFHRKARLALGTVLLQTALALGAFWIVGGVFGWSIEKTVVFGFATALSSTAVAIKILEDIDEVKSPVGQVTISTLVAQDLAVIPMLLVVSAFAATTDVETAALSVAFKLAVAVGLLLIVTRFLIRRDTVNIPFSHWFTSRAEVVPLAAMAFCFCGATLTGIAGLSAAYGAFIAGIIIGNSTMRDVMHKAAEPVQTLLMMVFFLSIGLLIDLDFIAARWQTVLGVLALVTVLKTVINFLIFRLLGETWKTAYRSSVVMAQVGEFSFILAATGLAVSALTPDNYRLLIAVIALSLLISPMWLAVMRRLRINAQRRWTRASGVKPMD